MDTESINFWMDAGWFDARLGRRLVPTHHEAREWYLIGRYAYAEATLHGMILYNA